MPSATLRLVTSTRSVTRIHDDTQVGAVARALLSGSGPDAVGLLAAVLDALPDGASVRDRGGRTVYANRPMRERFAPALAASHYLAGDSRTDLGLDCPTASALADGRPHDAVVEAEIDGDRLYLEYRATPLLGDEGEVVGALTVVRDRTREAFEARTAELARAKEMMGRILDGIPDAIALVDPDSGTPLYRNSTARTLPDGAKARIRDAIPTDALLAAPRTITRVVEYRDAKGDTRVYETFAYPVPSVEGRTLAIVYTRDVSARLALERQAIRNERLAVVGELAAGLAHEIRTPLTSISNSVKLLEGALPADADADTRLVLGILAKESKRLSGLLTDFLTFARPRPPKPVATDLNALAREAARVARGSRPQAERIAVDLELADDLPEAPVDPDQIRQALLNIVTNALDAAVVVDGAKARVVVRTAGPRQGRPGWEIRVADTGPGIDPADQARLFEPFFSKKCDGTGLGLAIAKRIVEAHAGRIEVSSGAGPGAVFTIVLPAASGAAPLQGA